MHNLPNITVGVTTVAFSKDQSLVSKLHSCGFAEVKTNTPGKRLSPQELLTFLSDCNAAIVGLDIINADVLDQLPNLRYIAKYGVGMDNIDLEACKARNVKVGYTPGVNKQAVAELALGYILSLLRNIYLTSNLLKQSKWHKDGGTQLRGKTVGIIGLGNIGKELARILSPFNCRIMANDIVDISGYCRENSIEPVTKDEIYNQADVISIHTPLTELTRNLINAAVFRRMKNNAILLNTARGGIVNLDDLKAALLTKKIAGAAIDVYDKEPPDDKELLAVPNLINTPHIGGNSKEAVEAMGIAAIDNLLKIVT